MIGALARAGLSPVVREDGARERLLIARVGVDDGELDRLLGPDVASKGPGPASGADRPGGLDRGGGSGWTVVDLDEVEVDRPLAEGPVERLLLIAGTMTDLRRAVTVRALLPPARNVTIAVGALPYLHPAPLPVASGHAGWRHLRDLHVRMIEKRSWVLETEFSEPLPAGEVLSAAARAFGGDHLDAMPQPRAALAGVGGTHWRPGDPNVVLTPAPHKGDCDVVLVAGADVTDLAEGRPGVEGAGDIGATAPGPAVVGLNAGRVGESSADTARDANAAGVNVAGVATDAGPAEVPPVVARPEPVEWSRFAELSGYGRLVGLADMSMVPPVDERSVNPGGFLQVPPYGYGWLEQRAGRWAAVHDGRVLARFAASGVVTDADVARLRKLRGLRVKWRLSHTGPIAAARVITGLAAAGVPLIAPDLPDWVRPLLGAELCGLISGVAEADLGDDLDREVHSVRLRRHALRTHGTRARWLQLTMGEVPGMGGPGIPGGPVPKVSVVLCTRRPDMLRFAISQVARQRGVDVELVLGLHGVPRSRVEEAVRSVHFPVTVYEADPSLPLGAVLNQAFARASGTYVTKMDDDDWYGPDHLADLALAQMYSGAELLGAPAEFVHLEQIGVTVQRSRRTECFRDTVAGGTLFMTRTLFETVGGFRPVPRHVDGEFCRAVRAAGGRIYQAHGLNYILRRRAAQGHTWREPIGYFLAQHNRRQWRGWYANPLMEL
ncbi:glycosyltransferase [Thermopolyspora sp. NPDC052614]|uniref:glycosyltransferase family 2 protein n=1 Tax=Thermopolyspora sp. NPDC052614 TaxID=3155682 RepID=UPI00344AA12E